MSRNNRLLIATFVGLGIFSAIQQPSYAQSTPVKSEKGATQDRKTIDLAPIAKEIKDLSRAVESVKSEPKSDDEIARETQDLQAQKDMAQWARLMYIATAVTTVLTAVGILLLGFTLHFTRHAARASDEMVSQARISSKAAVDAAAAADATARAMIAIEAPTIRPVALRAIVARDSEAKNTPALIITLPKVGFRNYGKTPAFPTEFKFDLTIIDKLPEEPKYGLSVKYAAEKVIAPEPQEGAFGVDIVWTGDRLPLSVEKAQSLVDGINQAYFYCSLVYEDAFGHINEARCCWIWNGEPGPRQFLVDNGAPPQYLKR